MTCYMQVELAATDTEVESGRSESPIYNRYLRVFSFSRYTFTVGDVTVLRLFTLVFLVLGWRWTMMNQEP